jgi:hypothetical protein
MTMPLDEFIKLAAEDAFDTYIDGGDSRLDLSYPALIYDVSESTLQTAVIMDMNNEDMDNCLIADPYDMFVNDIPALFFHSGYGWEFDRNPYYREEFKD